MKLLVFFLQFIVCVLLAASDPSDDLIVMDENQKNQMFNLHRKLGLTEQALFDQRKETQRLRLENSRLRKDQWQQLSLAMKTGVSPATAAVMHRYQKNAEEQARSICVLQERIRAMLQTNKQLKDTINGLHKVLKKTEAELSDYKQRNGCSLSSGKTCTKMR